MILENSRLVSQCFIGVLMASDFRFESLLKIRENERNKKKNAFLEAQTAIQNMRERVDQCKRKLEASQAAIRAQRASSTNADELCRQQRFHTSLLERLREAELKLSSLSELAEQKRNELNEAIKEVKVLQTLKEKTNERRLEEERRRSDKEVDELTTQQEALDRQKRTRA